MRSGLLGKILANPSHLLLPVGESRATSRVPKKYRAHSGTGDVCEWIRDLV
jgi:hypothetical protein